MSLPIEFSRAAARAAGGVPRRLRARDGSDVPRPIGDGRRAAAWRRLWIATIADVFRTAPAEHVDILRRDLALRRRMLARGPALTLTAAITLALGIGANTAIFSMVNGVLLAPLAYPQRRSPRAGPGSNEPDDDPGTPDIFRSTRLRGRSS